MVGIGSAHIARFHQVVLVADQFAVVIKGKNPEVAIVRPAKAENPRSLRVISPNGVKLNLFQPG
jgi:hypothetical protein